jgi:hypothetical protein
MAANASPLGYGRYDVIKLLTVKFPPSESEVGILFMGLATAQTSLHGVQDGRWDWLLRKQSLLRNAHPYRSPRGHFQSLKVSATLFFIYIAVRKQVCTAI